MAQHLLDQTGHGLLSWVTWGAHWSCTAQLPPLMALPSDAFPHPRLHSKFFCFLSTSSSPGAPLNPRARSCFPSCFPSQTAGVLFSHTVTRSRTVLHSVAQEWWLLLSTGVVHLCLKVGGRDHPACVVGALKAMDCLYASVPSKAGQPGPHQSLQEPEPCCGYPPHVPPPLPQRSSLVGGHGPGSA